MFKIAIKDLRLFLADKKATLLTFLLPIPLITLFSLAFGGSNKDAAPRAITLVVCDEDKTDASTRLVGQIDSLKEIDVRLTTLDTAEYWIKKGREDAVLILHKGLKDSLNSGRSLPLELRYDNAKQMQMGILMSALSGNLMRFIGTKSLEKKALAKFDKQNPDMDSIMRKGVHQMISGNFSGGSGGGETEPMLKATPMQSVKEASPGLVQAVAGTAVMMLLFSVAGLGASLLQEKEEGTLKKLLFSPLSPSHILFGKMISANIISMLQLLVMFLFSWLAFGLKISQNIPGLIIMIAATAFACSGFGIFLASIAKSRAQVQGMTTLIVLTMSAIGGSMIPSFVMPHWMQQMAVVSVNYWSIQGFYDIFWRALPVSDPTFLLRVGVLLGIGLVLNLAAIRMYKRNILNIA
ncbi:MAG TPA: ABC transporter permease [Bacteroidia bacterium]|jgi:ABC-type multidrug transport system permease subunit|nr:ABC transporter permease [Bacteroidia bacterium]